LCASWHSFGTLDVHSCSLVPIRACLGAFGPLGALRGSSGHLGVRYCSLVGPMGRSDSPGAHLCLLELVWVSCELIWTCCHLLGRTWVSSGWLRILRTRWCSSALSCCTFGLLRASSGLLWSLGAPPNSLEPGIARLVLLRPIRVSRSSFEPASRSFLPLSAHSGLLGLV